MNMLGMFPTSPLFGAISFAPPLTPVLKTQPSHPTPAALQQALGGRAVRQNENDALYARWAELTEKAG